MFLFVRIDDTRRAVGAISDDDVRLLAEQLESASPSTLTYFIDRGTVRSLEATGASSAMLALVEGAMGTEDSIDIELEGAPPEELTTPDLEGAEAVDLAGAPPTLEAVNLVEAVNLADAPAVLELPVSRVDEAVTVDGRALQCVVCQGDSFQRRSAQLQSLWATTFGAEQVGPSADCYICNNCGYVHWFLW